MSEQVQSEGMSTRGKLWLFAVLVAFGLLAYFNGPGSQDPIITPCDKAQQATSAPSGLIRLNGMAPTGASPNTGSRCLTLLLAALVF